MEKIAKYANDVGLYKSALQAVEYAISSAPAEYMLLAAQCINVRAISNN